MEFFRKLERRYGRYAIHNLMNYIVAMYVVGMILQYVNPMLYWQWLCLNPEAILHGQIWRIVNGGSGRA